MDWPDTCVEDIPSESFWPAFCPWPDCSQHQLPEGGRAEFHRHGFYRRGSDDALIPRYICQSCRRTCSRQTFSCTYYLKRPDLTAPIAAALEAGSGHRQAARSQGCAPTSVTRRAARLGRHAMLLLARALGCSPPIDEPVVADHFETFAFSQDFPFGIATAVGSRSWFVYGLDPAPHRPGGPPRRRSAADSPDPRGGYRASFRRLLDGLLSLVGPSSPLEIVTDGHEAYTDAIGDHPLGDRLRHHRYPNPPRRLKGEAPTAKARAFNAAMFPVNLLHALLRHSCAHHRRETIAFGRRLNALMERMFLAAVWRNFVKRGSERRGGTPTPAMRRGLADEPWSWTRVFSRRLFPSRTSLPPVWKELYERRWITPAVGKNRRHDLVRAY